MPAETPSGKLFEALNKEFLECMKNEAGLHAQKTLKKLGDPSYDEAMMRQGKCKLKYPLPPFGTNNFHKILYDKLEASKFDGETALGQIIEFADFFFSEIDRLITENADKGIIREFKVILYKHFARIFSNHLHLWFPAKAPSFHKSLDSKLSALKSKNALEIYSRN